MTALVIAAAAFPVVLFTGLAARQAVRTRTESRRRAAEVSYLVGFRSTCGSADPAAYVAGRRAAFPKAFAAGVAAAQQQSRARST